MVQEAEVSSLTTVDAQLALPIGIRHLSKGGRSAESAETIKQEMSEVNVCLRHLQQKLIETKNGVIRSHAKCYSYCPSCVEIKKVCADCERKGHQNIEPELRACDHCLNNEVKCNTLAVIGVTQDSESRNAGGQRMLMEEKTGRENPNLNIVSVFPDAVHVAKRKWRSFKKIPLSAVRNRDRQDVDSILQISDVALTDALKDNAVVVTHTVVPEKYRITDDNKKGILNSPVGMTMVSLGNVFISDVETGKVVKVRASHYPASVAIEVDSLDCPVGIAYNNGVLYIVESRKSAIVYKDLTGETVVEPSKLTVKQLQTKLKDAATWDDSDKKKSKTSLKEKLQKILNEKASKKKTMVRNQLQLEQDIIHPLSLAFDKDDQPFVSTKEGKIFKIKVEKDLVSLSGVVIAEISLNSGLLCGLAFVNEKLQAASHANNGGSWW
ncbi:uncharacterized protein [Montipora foliosa]|uniref:uncharacterized protein n=1 Tax=Montipora foliosa TaxID=591990 RepID=UPI0035F1D75F